MKYDVVIIGGGAAGSVLASRLAADAQTSVLLLEAGPDYPDPADLPDDIKFGHTRFAEAPDSKHNWALRGTITEEQGEIHVAQGKVIGGGSSINGQAMQRGFPEDFDAWAALGNEEWSYAKVLPYFRKSEHDLDIQDELPWHGRPHARQAPSDGPWPAIQQAFHAACVQAGFGTTNGYEWPAPRWPWRVALEQPGRHAHEHGADASQSDAPLSEPDGAGRGVRPEDRDQGWQGRRRGSRKRREGVHRRQPTGWC